MHEGVKQEFDTSSLKKLEPSNAHFFKSVDADCRTIETRESYLLLAISCPDLPANWFGIKIFGMVISTREIGAKVTTETRYFVTSIYANAAEFGKSVRQHWGLKTLCNGYLM